MNSISRFDRKTIRLKDYDYSTPGEYFVTICTHEHICILGNIVDEEMRLSEEGLIAKQSWEELPNHFKNIKFDEYVIMPNHIHGIINIIEPVGAIHESPLRMTQYQRRIMKLPKIIGRFKMTSAKKINLSNNTIGAPIWQRGYYEHIIRSEKDLNNIRDYISNNPVKWFFDNENPVNVLNRKGLSVRSPLDK
jgi:putative transposase